MKVEVRPLPLKKWHGKTGKESFTRSKTLNILVDPKTMQYATGLDYSTKSFENPENPKLKITEAQYYERILKADLSPQYNPNIVHPYWDTKIAKIKLENKPMFFDTDVPQEYIKIKNMKASKFVANSLREYEEGLYPHATHYLKNTEEEVKIQSNKVNLRIQTILSAQKISSKRKAEIVLILSDKNYIGKSEETISLEFYKILDERTEEVSLLIQGDEKEVSSKALVIEALQKSVLTKQGHRILYLGSEIGITVEDVVAYLNKDENQELKLRILEAIGR